MKLSLRMFLLLILTTLIVSEPDPNFYIYLAFGQSNMEGQGDIEQEDIDGVTDRFQMMPAINMTEINRFTGHWYKAVPPLCRRWSHISPLDIFGRTVVEYLPENIKIGVINVAVGGASIDIFDEDKAEEYVKTTEDWLQQIAAEYGNHPYKVLMDAAKKAQKYGVIKGILLHQGETDNGDQTWPDKVKLIYERMLKELNLKNEDVPLLVGELVGKDQDGMCALHNEIIAKVPSVIPNSFVISSEGCTHRGDRLHFSKQGYQLLGKRYAITYLKYLGIEVQEPDPNFYIYLAFGQSNMEGQGDIEQEDIDGVTDRFQMMPAIDMPEKNRVTGQWYKAVPPLCRQDSHISPLDIFGRIVVENLPENIKIGVINVAVGGGSIDIFDEDKAEDYIKTTEDWLKEIAAKYGNHPYKVLMDAAKKAQKYGVIKGILLHQGETDNGDQTWPNKVKLIYERMLKELNLKNEDVPLFVGELVGKDQDGMCSLHNEIIAKVPSVIPNSYVVSSEGCTHRGDRLHFSKQGYKLLGRRYAEAYLKYLGIEIPQEGVDPNFYIFLAFGQSNMEGQGDIEEQDRQGISDRFKMMPAVNFTTDGRKAGEWYKADPPLCRDWARISPLDYFGRTLVEKLPQTKKVGVINVSVGGASIVLFDEDRAESYLQTTEDWLQNIAAIYGNNPFRVLVNTAKQAQKSGVIKGILLHQGESDNGDQNWPKNVKLVYDRLLEELGLKEENVPLLVGELVSNEQGGLCYGHNKIIATITNEIKNSYVISSEGCPSQNDGFHFNTEGNRMMGRRYGETMYEYLKNHNDI